MITRVLFVDSDARALARIKVALEQAGPYEASVFVTGRAALEHAADQPPAIAIIALNVTDIPPTVLASRLRTIVPGLPILLRAPADTDRQILQTIDAQGMVEGGYTVRNLIPQVNTLARSDEAPPAAQPGLPPRAARPPAPPPPAPEPAPAAAFDSGTPVLRGHPDDDMSTFDEVLRAIEPDQPPAADDSFRQLVESMRAPAPPAPLPHRREKLASWATGDDSMPPDVELSVAGVPGAEDVLFQRIRAEEPPMPDLEDSGTVSDLIAVTDFNAHRSEAPVVAIPEEMIAAEEALPELLPSEEEQRALLHAISALDEPASVEAEIEWRAPFPAEPPASAPTGGDSAAALALQLTQQTLQSAAQASVLVRDGSIVAAAGELDARALAALVAMADCETVLAEQVTRIKLIALPEQHLSYLVVAAPTVDRMALLTIFPEHMQIGKIRHQARAILAALAEAEEAELARIAQAAAQQAARQEAERTARPATPPATPASSAAITQEHAAVIPPTAAEAPEEERSPAAPAEIDRAGLVSYACVWIVRNPDDTLDPDLMQALREWLPRIAAERRWVVEYLDIQPDYVSAVIGVSPEDMPGAVATALMTGTAQHIVQARPERSPAETLWADAYYVVTPGRPLTGQEIGRFISYQRQN